MEAVCLKPDLATLPVTQLRGVGPRMQGRLAKLKLYTLQDVLFHLPSRYQDRTRIHPIAHLKVGDHAVIEGHIDKVRMALGKRRSLVCQLMDASGTLNLRFFHFNATQKENLIPGVILRCFGQVRLVNQTLEMAHPEYQIVAPDTIVPVAEHLTPIYPSTEGLSQGQLRTLIASALTFTQVEQGLREWIPVDILDTFSFPTLLDALQYVHKPPADAPVAALLAGSHAVQQRLAFEELLAHQLSARQRRAASQQFTAPQLKGRQTLSTAFLQQLKFELTGAQQRVMAEIEHDLAAATPMRRLLQGDVGSGKTVVAAKALLQAVENKVQAAFMVPTELLAEQHFLSLAQWFSKLKLNMVLLVGQTPAKIKKQYYADLAEGKVDIVIGTHALIQEQVVFKHLGLIVIDEQHRFGVDQRQRLQQKGEREAKQHPHQLLMSATPIPRTLAMTAYADVDVSIIDELPPGRMPIQTIALPDSKRDVIIDRISAACQAGRQAYWVCTLIEASDNLACQAAEETALQLSKALQPLKVGLVHGRMPSEIKEVTMAAFKAGDLQVLVATTVIEVGVDVPNASLMIIDNPERLGLAQLHQLRGRVGRGDTASHCVLMYHAPLANTSQERLKILRATTDGFKIAEHDLKLRGPGEVLGTQQTGLSTFRIADIVRDNALIPKAQQAASKIQQDYPEHAEHLIARWLQHNQGYAWVG